MRDQAFDYRSENLQNRSFVGQDLTGANFSGADLRGCDFTRAILVGTNFERALTGQTSQQINTAVLYVIIGAIAIISISIIFSFAVLQIDSLLFSWLGEFYRRISGIFPTLLLFLLYFFQGDILARFPNTSKFFSDASIGILFVIMATITLGLIYVSFAGSTFLMLIPSVISAIIALRILGWLREIISNQTGTSFRKANLTDANLSHALINHTDFSFALLTGIYIDGWKVDSQTIFTKSRCEYLYLQPNQERYPVTGNLLVNEWEAFLEASVLQSPQK